MLEHSDGDFARQMMTSFGDEKRVGEGVDAWHSDALSAIDELAELGVRLPNADHIRSVLANPLRNQFIADAAKESEMSITTYLAAVSKHIEQILQEGVFCINIGGKENPFGEGYPYEDEGEHEDEEEYEEEEWEYGWNPEEVEETLKRVRKGGYIAGEGATEFGDTEYTHRHLMGYDSEPSSGVKTLVYGYLYPENFMGRGPTMWERGVGNTTMREYGPIRLSFDSTVLRTDGVTVSYGDYGMLNNWKEDYTPRTICLPYTSTSPRVRTLIASVRHLMYDFQTGMSNKRGWGEDPNESNVIGKFRNTSANNTPYGTDYIEVHYPGGEIAPEHIETVFNVATERPVD